MGGSDDEADDHGAGDLRMAAVEAAAMLVRCLAAEDHVGAEAHLAALAPRVRALAARQRAEVAAEGEAIATRH